MTNSAHVQKCRSRGRRRVVAFLAVGLQLCFSCAISSSPLTGAPIDDVDPFIGTGVNGNCYPGAQAPFGMISWSPNTTFDDYTSDTSRPGYKYDRDAIYGFTVTHISGIGCHGAQDLPIMPVRGGLTRSPVGDRSVYASHFSHAQEAAQPGYYRVRLDDAQVDVELTVTERAGLGRFTFAPGAARSIVFRPTETINGITAAALHVDASGRRVSGFLISGGFCSRDPGQYDYRLCFYAEFDQPIIAHGFWHGDRRVEGDDDAVGSDIAGFVTLSGDAGPVQMRLGLSYVSEENARANLHAEIPTWDFPATLAATQASWNTLLGRLAVDAPAALRQELATALYHNLLQPSLFDDVNGEYVGFDDAVHRIASGHHKYVNFSNWDTYRTSAQLQAMLVPEQASDMAASLLLDAQQGAPAGFPIWGYYNNETHIMNGYSSVPWIANAFAFGARDYDRGAMKDALLQAADTKYERGDRYRELGYVPVIDSPWDYSASRTLEYGIDDFALAQMCRALDDPAAAARLQNRAQNAFNLIDPQTRYVRPRNADGTWTHDFSPTGEAGFNEGNSTQYTWSVPQNVSGLIAALGGPEATETRLDAFCSRILVEGWNTTQPNFWLSNEPCFGVPFIYSWLGKPGKTQDVLRRVLAEFHATPDGLPGDDDVGAMSAYQLWIALGLYPSIPGTGGFVLAAPAVDGATLHLPDHHTLRITTEGPDNGRDYVRAVELNGRPWTSSWVPLVDLLAQSDNTLTIHRGAAPDSAWGSRPSDLPPSFGAAKTESP